MATVVFMGTPDFAVPSLRKLIATQTVVGVVTQPDRPAGRGRQPHPPPVKVVAESAGIQVYQPKSLRDEEAAAPLREWQPQIIVVAAFGQILGKHVLDLPPHGGLNVHASLLPRWRGASPIQHAILAGDEQTGVSLMQMDQGLDTGPVYAQRATPMTSTDTFETLHDRLAQLGAEMLGQCLDDILGGRLTAQAQDDSQKSYAPLIKKQDGAINWNQSAAQIDRHIRAMSPWPSAFTTWQGNSLKVLSARPLKNVGLPAGIPGQVIEYGDRVVVLTGDGAMQLQEIQLAGKRATRVMDFIRGRPDFVGSRLGR